ncbi:glycoside hydrolase family 3 protein [Leptospira ilyithenensis]|uniref:beta-N-acetylhexosaminidase n=1 Tax=Leptospira ilyithenensis TaxID=2484901 RepID=A0A4R9LWK1_9LEPT|nr:glycoside hydrolase family 3 protein [Leptospira ilyithenensis]TGN13768.1 glycoside hydrolase family 3 protein [Leptospira ilyithenensis]
MNKVLLRLSFSIFLVFGFIGTSYFFSFYITELRADEREAWLDKKAWDITNKLTDEELVGQTIHIAIPSKTVDAIATEEIQKTKPGGIILFGKNLGKKQEIISLTSNLQKMASGEGLQPFLISTDQEGGRVFRVQDGITEYPGAMAVGQTGKEEWGKTVGFVTSYELKELGINFLFAPILDINNNPQNPVINTRSFGSDVERVSKVAVAYEQGARLGGALPVIKHFPGHGDTNVDSHLGLPVITKTLAELETLELVPFKKAIDSGAEAVMTAHIVYPLIDEKYPATLSKKILTGILREKLKFNGIIITDAMEMYAISKNYEKDRPGVLAILAGANIVLLTSWGDTARRFKEQLSDAYSKGDFFVTDAEGKKRDLLKEAVFKQIRKKLEMGLYYTAPPTPNIYSENENIKEFLAKKEEIRNLKYKELTENGYFLKNITNDSIRAYPNVFSPPKDPKTSTLSLVKNIHLKKSLDKKGIQAVTAKQLAKAISKKEITHILMDSSSEKEISNITALSKKYPNKRFVVLHGGTPFVKLPVLPNLSYLLSFSLTSHSWEALGEKYKAGEEIPKVDLILLPKDSKTPLKGAFPEAL